jgi:hypothetical protein
VGVASHRRMDKLGGTAQIRTLQVSPLRRWLRLFSSRKSKRR